MAANRLLGTATTMLLVSYAMAATSCNLAVARNEDSFLESYTLPTRTSTAYPGSRTSDSTYDDNFYLPTIPTSNPGLDRNLQIIQDAQDAVDIIGGPGRKRDAGLKCADGDSCVDGGASMTPYCINVETGHWYGMTGYSGSVTTGDYYDPEGERGNLYDGPCPGDLYSDRSSGGCARVVNSVPPNDPATSFTSTLSVPPSSTANRIASYTASGAASSAVTFSTSTIGEATPSPMPNMTASGSVDSVSAAESGRPTNETTAGVTPYTGAASSLSTFALSICITGTAVLALLA
ncbi:hypothetical protein KC320_g4349 [Hortaea werneckii]|nr:hypothetical protein KC320_g4349 [Hortaea werneckii]